MFFLYSLFCYASAVEKAGELGNLLVMNMVMLGALNAVTGVPCMDAIEKSVAERFPRLVDLNLRAVRAGVDLLQG